MNLPYSNICWDSGDRMWYTCKKFIKSIKSIFQIAISLVSKPFYYLYSFAVRIFVTTIEMKQYYKDFDINWKSPLWDGNIYHQTRLRQHLRICYPNGLIETFKGLIGLAPFFYIPKQSKYFGIPLEWLAKIKQDEI